MDCPELATLLRYIHAETTAAATEEITRHMEQCEHCDDEVRTLRALATHLAQVALPAPLAATACVELLTLAAYLDHRLPAAEQAHVTQHLDACVACRDALTGARQQLAMVAEAPQTMPAALLAQAIQLGAPPARLAPPWGQRLGTAWEQYVAGPWSALTWRWAFGGMAVTALLAVAFLGTPTPDRPGGTTAPPPRSYGYGFGTAPEVVLDSRVALSPDLTQALRLYHQDPTPQAQQALLAALRAAPLPIPAEQVSTIELKRALQEALDDPAAPQLSTLHVQWLPDGLLLLGATP